VGLPRSSPAARGKGGGVGCLDPAGKGVGHAPGKGIGELPPIPRGQETASGKSAPV